MLLRDGFSDSIFRCVDDGFDLRAITKRSHGFALNQVGRTVGAGLDTTTDAAPQQTTSVATP